MVSPASGLLVPGRVMYTAASRNTLRPAPTPSRVRLPMTTARRTPRVQLRCAKTSALEAVTEEELKEFMASLPSWAPSIEELMEFESTDFSPEAIHERFVRDAREAKAAVKGAVDGLILRPLRELAADVRKIKGVADVEEFHIGVLVGALMACVGLYRLCKAAPSECLAFAVPYAFYRLSVMAAEVRRRGFAPDFIIRLKLLITIGMLVTASNKVSILEYAVRYALFGIYFLSVGLEIKGLKKYARYFWPILTESFTTPQGRQDSIDTLWEMAKNEDD
ncbi:hypothetical protein PR202_ga15396 [Eleusine coracana subsp. coracana]|uniref:Uncharacterized protein n=1 Tax=Eleusine coracana subsp. coracana TaxID=191504 RepID=A0AAV5CK30_ELECO|nr:hypothetical protein PR202_ga15396 [Eleusine coracana subsp. coracana]